MIKETPALTGTSLTDESDRPEYKKSGCRAFLEFMEWQVRQYRNAVEENKWYMGERLDRDIAWKDAERDFLRNHYYDCALKWRKEYCIEQCSHFTICTLGHNFSRK